MNEIGNWLLNQEGTSVYITLFLMLLGGALGLPIPEDIPLIFSGIMAQQGRCSFDGVLGVAYLGIILGDLLIFFFGYKFGPALYRWKAFRRFITPGRAERIHRRLTRHSLWMIFLARHLFYLRTATFLTCGLFRMSIKRFIISDALAALVSVPLMISLGFALAENFDLLSKVLARTKVISLVVGIFLLIVAAILVRNRLNRRSELE